MHKVDLHLVMGTSSCRQGMNHDRDVQDKNWWTYTMSIHLQALLLAPPPSTKTQLQLCHMQIAVLL